MFKDRPLNKLANAISVMKLLPVNLTWTNTYAPTMIGDQIPAKLAKNHSRGRVI